MKTSLSHRMTKTDRQADTDEGTDRRENCQTLRKRAHCNTNNLCNMCMPLYKSGKYVFSHLNVEQILTNVSEEFI